MHVKLLECRWNVCGDRVDLLCDACKATMECMWGASETQVDVSYTPCWNSFEACTEYKWTQSGRDKCNKHGAKVIYKWECVWSQNVCEVTMGMPFETCGVATPLLEECEDDTHTPKMGTWESSETPKTSKLNCKGQNTSP
jgi:hypothetical protein